MKRLLVLFMLLLPLNANAGFMILSSGTGNVSTGDSPTFGLVNLDSLIASGVIKAASFEKTTATLWDIPLDAPDTTQIDTTKVWLRGNPALSAGARRHYHMENFSGAKKDTLGFMAEMAPVVLDNDSAYISIICEDSLKVAFDIYVISDGDTILVSTLSGANLYQTWHEHTLPFTAAFAENKLFVAIVRVRIDAGAWVRFSSSLRVK